MIIFWRSMGPLRQNKKRAVDCITEQARSKFPWSWGAAA